MLKTSVSRKTERGCSCQKGDTMVTTAKESTLKRLAWKQKIIGRCLLPVNTVRRLQRAYSQCHRKD